MNMSELVQAVIENEEFQQLIEELFETKTYPTYERIKSFSNILLSPLNVWKEVMKHILNSHGFSESLFKGKEQHHKKNSQQLVVMSLEAFNKFAESVSFQSRQPPKTSDDFANYSLAARCSQIVLLSQLQHVDDLGDIDCAELKDFFTSWPITPQNPFNPYQPNRILETLELGEGCYNAMKDMSEGFFLGRRPLSSAAVGTSEKSSIKRAHRAVSLWEKSRNKLLSQSSAFSSSSTSKKKAAAKPPENLNDDNANNSTKNETTNTFASKRNISTIQLLENSQNLQERRLK